MEKSDTICWEQKLQRIWTTQETIKKRPWTTECKVSGQNERADFGKNYNETYGSVTKS